MPFPLQLGEQHLLVAQGIGEQLLIQLTAAGLLSSNSLRASSSSNHAPITGLMLNSDSWLGVIRRLGMAACWLFHSFALARFSHHPNG